VAGTGGGSLRTWTGQYGEEERVQGEYARDGLHGYVLVTVDGPGATIRWKALAGGRDESDWQVLDTFSYTMTAPAGRSVRADRRPSVGGRPSALEAPAE
jgi:hypothetical protein